MLPLRLPVVSDRWWPTCVAALCWALAAASGVFWWLHSPLQDPSLVHPVQGVVPSAGAPSVAAVARALGHGTAHAAVPDALQRFQLQGVIAADSGHGSALLVLDGRPAQAFVPGQEVGEGWRLHAVHASGVRLVAGSGGAALDLALPDRP